MGLIGVIADGGGIKTTGFVSNGNRLRYCSALFLCFFLILFQLALLAFLLSIVFVMAKTLYHWTSSELLKEILDSKRLELEGHHYVNGHRERYPVSAQIALDEQYFGMGRFLWFTESQNYQSSSGETGTKTAKTIDSAIVISSDQLNVKKWHYVKKENQNNAVFMKVAASLDQTAKNLGDNPYDWWVSSEPVDLNGLEYSCILPSHLMKAND